MREGKKMRREKFSKNMYIAWGNDETLIDKNRDKTKGFIHKGI